MDVFGNRSAELFRQQGLGNAWTEYIVDTAQRTILTWDALRRRGNQYVEHIVKGLPPVLVFDYEPVMDGKSLERPVNYLLLKIRPDPAHPVDPAKRPIVVVDPRAGHGPGIGGFKPDSQIGLAVKNGYPCYFVSFTPNPVPGQTIEDVARAEAAFLRKVADLHPDAEDRPVVIGNCQAGWAVAMLSAVAPELMSVVILNGAPLSYWAGEVGNNPMRYLGGLMGGTWLAAMTSDLGNGLFDGANLVSNFESLDPANTLWKKPYNLFANIDEEADRFVTFERWWGGHFLLAKDEMRFITDELFVGNKLALGDIQGSSGTRVNLRNIKAPIVVFASKGDNITTPQQALNWILDVYESTEDIRASGQVIIYMLHESIGHLGIFVSAKVAKREHRAMVDNLDVISALPPGLYEMTIDDSGQGKPPSIGFEKRDLDDIRGLDDSRREELFFLPVQHVSEVNNQVYDRFLSPWVQLVSNGFTAEMMRRANSSRLERWMWSEVNPLMALVAEWAGQIRADRRPAAADNPFRAAEKQFSDRVVQALDGYRDSRDHLTERLFYAIYAPLKMAWSADEQRLLERRSRQLAQRSRQAGMWLQENVLPHMAEGGLVKAVLRVLLWLSRRRPAVDAQRFRLAEKALVDSPQFAGLDSRQMRDLLREQFFLLMLDEQEAIARLPDMLAEEQDRTALMELVDKVVADCGGASAEQAADLDHIRNLLVRPAVGAEEERSPQRRSARRRPPGDGPYASGDERPLH